MEKKMSFEKFLEKFHELSVSQRVSLWNEYQMECRVGDGCIYDFDEDFFNEFFNDPMEAARATYFGNIDSWSDPYIKFNAYGNLESLTEYDVRVMLEDELEDIYEHDEIWGNYIDED